MKQININKAIEKIYDTKGKIFKATFRKKNGRYRRMICRLGVKSYLTGGKLNYNPRDYGLVIVFDMEKKAYRSINTLTLMYLTIAGKKYEIIHWIK